jgi:peptidoglycan hydrolase-like protein with peptidoglycan-binding domain
MVTSAPPRTFKLKAPHITGPDVSDFQRALNRRFAAWKSDRRVVVDGDYGKDTRTAARQVCRGLGIDHEEAMRHGVAPELRSKIRDPKRRTPEEIRRARSEGAKAFRARLRSKFKNAGKVMIAPSANAPGRPIQPLTLDYVTRMAALIKRPITITTGTNHDKFTVNGNISDHFSGHAVDIGMAANGGSDDSPVGDRIMEAALRLAGVPAGTAGPQARGGGLFTFTHAGMRIQCIWKTNEGGNHHNHVHVGVRPA